jgi:hypothetical protein
MQHDEVTLVRFGRKRCWHTTDSAPGGDFVYGSNRKFGGVSTSFRVKKDIFVENSQPTMTPVSALGLSQSPSEARSPAALPNPAGFLRIHGLALGALKRLAELLEVLYGAIYADLSH